MAYMIVQDSSGAPVGNVLLTTTSAPAHDLSIGGSITNATGTSRYGVGNVTIPTLSTDESGNATLWLLPTGSDSTYTFTATSPSGSPYSQFTLNNITVSGDQTQIISLQRIVTTQSITGTIQQMYADGEITKLGSSFTDKPTTAQSYIDAGNYTQAISTLEALIHQVEAQIDIHITPEAGATLITQINSLINSLPQ